MIRLAVIALVLHFLAPLLYAVLFEQYGGDDILWHPRNLIVYSVSIGAMIVCPVLLTGMLYYARWGSPQLLADGIFELWLVDMVYTLIILIFMMTPAAY